MNLSGKTSVTLTGDELFYIKVALAIDIDRISDFMKDGDPNGVWGRELENLRAAYKKFDRASRRV